ncbi:hypothetical protein [Pseudomonas aeruginosa]|uniref:hypothetical protein n=1 Tax=Pseudomonas aeruginosa TaxID=287 RepID=UPI0032B57E20
MEDLDARLGSLLVQVANLEQRQASGEARYGTPFTVREDERAFRAFESYIQWRYENPGRAKLASVGMFAASSCFVLLILWWAAGTGMGEATGLDGVRKRLEYAYYGVLWATRDNATDPSEQAEPPKRMSGSIQQVFGDVMLVDCYEDGKSVRRLVRLANVIISDKHAFSAWVEAYKLKGIQLDFYRPIGQVNGYDVWGVVIWHHKTLLNVQPVEMGIAVPEKNPPTTVVNQIFAGYYWNKAKG